MGIEDLQDSSVSEDANDHFERYKVEWNNSQPRDYGKIVLKYYGYKDLKVWIDSMKEIIAAKDQEKRLLDEKKKFLLGAKDYSNQRATMKMKRSKIPAIEVLPNVESIYKPSLKKEIKAVFSSLSKCEVEHIYNEQERELYVERHSELYEVYLDTIEEALERKKAEIIQNRKRFYKRFSLF